MKRTLSSPAFITLAALGTTALTPHVARAEPPTAFEPAFQGFGTGAVVGLGTGYLFARQDGWNGDTDWKPMVYGAGIGALAGGALGLGLGVADLARGSRGGGAIVLRDTWYGTGFGVVAGLIAGGLVAISQKEGEPVLAGAAIGSIAGAGLGLGVGFWEASRTPSSAQVLAPTPPVAFVIGAARAADRRLVFVPTVAARF